MRELDEANSTNAAPGTIRASYISAGVDRVLARQSPTSGTYHYLSDALGSTTRLTDDNGATLVNYSYDPYGGTKADAAIDNPFQYTGRENDQTGLYYYRARYYSPQYQRFISEDPIGLAGGINVYAYVEGNPVSYTDPLGLMSNCEAAFMAVGGTAGAYIGAWLGGAAGGFFGGFFGTFVLPGVGTIGGAGAGAATGAYVGGAGGLVAGASFGSWLGEALCPIDCPESNLVFSKEKDEDEKPEHTKNARPSTYDKHTKPRPGRDSEKKKQKPGWKTNR